MGSPPRRLLLGISVAWIPLAFLFDGVTVLMLPLRLAGDATNVGLVSMAGLALAAGLQPVAGWASDRLRDRVDRRAFLAAAAVPALLGLWLLVGTTGLLAALVGYVVLQVGATSLQAAQQTFIPEHLDADRRGRASGLKAAFDVGGAFLAFLVLGALLAAGSLAPAATVVSVLLVAAVALVLLLVPPALRSDTRPGPSRGWSFELPPGLASLIAARFLFLLATYTVGRFLVLLVSERLAIPLERAVEQAGWLLALLTLTTAVAAIPMGWVADRASRRTPMIVGAVVAAAGILLLVPSLGLAGILSGGLLMSLGTAAFVTANWAATADLVPPRESGRLMGVANLGTGLAAAAAGAFGPLIDASGFVPALVLAALASAAAALPLLIHGIARRAAHERAR